MTGQHDNLRHALEQLQAHLAELRELDPSVAEHLDATLADAQRVVAGEQPDGTHHTVTEQLGETMRNYEASHPTLAGNLRSVIDALAQIGI